MDIILIGHVASAGTLELVEHRLEELKKVYSGHWLRAGIEKLGAEYADEECMKMLSRDGVYTFAIGRTGVYQALWRLGETLNCGMRIDADALRIDGFAIEISDYFDVNPYLANSLGCVLVCTDGGARLCGELKAAGYEAEVIGFTTEDNDRTVRRGELITYLTPD